MAEGIEDAPTLEALRTGGCDLVQGYLLGRPVAARDLDLGRSRHVLPPAIPPRPLPDQRSGPTGMLRLVVQRTVAATVRLRPASLLSVRPIAA